MRSAATSMPASRPPGIAAPGSSRSADGTSFSGNLNGQGHTISGLFINRLSIQNIGLIGFLAAGGTVSNVGVIGATITGWEIVGGIVGTNYGTVSNVYSSGSVTATSAGAGGLIGYNFQTVSNGYSSSTVSGPLYVGGAIGLNNCGVPAALLPRLGITGLCNGRRYRHRRQPERCRRAGRLQRQLHHAVLLGHLHDRTDVRRRHAVRAA